MCLTILGQSCSLMCEGRVSLTATQQGQGLKVRDLTASLISEICSNVCTEHTLNPISGQSPPTSTVCTDGARLDVAADGFWGSRNERVFFDVHVFNPWLFQMHHSPSPVCTKSEKKNVNMVQGSRKLSMSASPHLCSLQLEVWDRNPQQHIRD